MRDVFVYLGLTLFFILVFVALVNFAPNPGVSSRAPGNVFSAQGNQYVNQQEFSDFIKTIQEIFNKLAYALQKAVSDNMGILNDLNQRILQLTGINLGNVFQSLVQLWIALLQWVMNLLNGILPK